MMRSYDEPIEVRRGIVSGQEVPAQFIWRDKLWVVRDVISHWVETGAWWERSGVAALFGVGTGSPAADDSHSGGECGGEVHGGDVRSGDLLGEQEFWRVEAGRGRAGWGDLGDGAGAGAGVFDLCFDWAGGQWHLIRSID